MLDRFRSNIQNDPAVLNKLFRNHTMVLAGIDQQVRGQAIVHDPFVQRPDQIRSKRGHCQADQRKRGPDGPVESFGNAPRTKLRCSYRNAFGPVLRFPPILGQAPPRIEHFRISGHLSNILFSTNRQEPKRSADRKSHICRCARVGAWRVLPHKPGSSRGR